MTYKYDKDDYKNNKKCNIIGIKIKNFIFWKIVFLAISQKPYKTEETGIFRHNQFEENTHIRLDENFFFKSICLPNMSNVIIWTHIRPFFRNKIATS